MAEAGRRMPMRILAYILMPNHWGDPADGVDFVNEPQGDAELEALRRSVTRSCRFGSDAWQETIARQLELGASLRPQGRPRKLITGDGSLVL